jgi:signal transduction histidine kinase
LDNGAVVMADPLLLQRLLGNLLSNAIKYTERGGVLLACRRRGGQLCMEVWDTGLGIAPEHHQQIFQEFYKVPTHSGTADSFGLGLAIVARLAAILGYPVSLQSVPGRGSVFRLQMSDVDAAKAHQRTRLTLTQLAKNPWVRA